MDNGTRPLFSILHTSARPDKWKEIYDAWMKAAVYPQFVEYVLVVDHDWGFEELPVLREQDKVLWARGPRHNYVAGVNLAAVNSTGRVLIVNADDQYPAPEWDEELRRRISADHNVGDELVVLPSTGTPAEYERKIAVMPILTRARYERYGYVFYPMYESMYADNDFLASARSDERLGKGHVLEALDLMFPHKHPINEGATWDVPYQVQNRPEAMKIGRMLFEAREALRFQEEDKGIGGQIYSGGRPRLALCCPGEQFSSEWVVQWTEIMGQLGAFFDLVPLFSYSTSVFTVRECLADAANRANANFVLWIDDDNLVAPGQIVHLWHVLEQRKDIDILCGWCWLQSDGKKVISRVSLGDWDADGLTARTWDYSKLMEGDEDIKQIGFTGFPVVLMRADVLKDGPCFLPVIHKTYPWSMSGEDVGFCQRARTLGLKICVDRTVKVPHLKLKLDEPENASSSADLVPVPIKAGASSAGEEGAAEVCGSLLTREN
jgi:hypothetical protein